MKEEVRKIRFNGIEIDGKYVERVKEMYSAVPIWPIGVNIEECAYQLYLEDQEAQENTQSDT
jgi:hypothetical protein